MKTVQQKFSECRLSIRAARLAGIVLFGCMGLMPAPVRADTATGTLLVSAVVLSVCAVAATPLVFGDYDGISLTPADAQATITVTCTSGTPYTIALGAGGGSGATVASRYMTFGANLLNYLLYTDSGHTTLWGDGTSSTSTVGGTSSGVAALHTVYGRIPIAQYVPSGAYVDTVTVTVTY